MNKVTRMMMVTNKANKNKNKAESGRMNDYQREGRDYDDMNGYGRNLREMPYNRQMRDRYDDHYSRYDGMRGGDRRRYDDGRPYGIERGGMDYGRQREGRSTYGRRSEDWDDMDDDDRHKAKLNDYNPWEWAKDMKNTDGSSGAHWSMEDTETVRKTRNINDCKPEDFWIAMNMMYSDYQGVAKKYGIDKPEFYADMAKSFLTDKDSKQGREKLEAYYEYVVNKGLH